MTISVFSNLQYCNYPNPLKDPNNPEDNPARQFRYFPYAGAKISQITTLQVPLVNQADIDLATVTAGATDIDFSAIMNCYLFQYQFWGSPKQCDSILNDGMDPVNSAQFSSDLDDILKAQG